MKKRHFICTILLFYDALIELASNRFILTSLITLNAITFVSTKFDFGRNISVYVEMQIVKYKPIYKFHNESTFQKTPLCIQNTQTYLKKKTCRTSGRLPERKLSQNLLFSHKLTPEANDSLSGAELSHISHSHSASYLRALIIRN